MKLNYIDQFQKAHNLPEEIKIQGTHPSSPSAGHRDSEDIGSAKQWETTAYEVGEQLLQAQRNYNSLYDQTTKDATAFKQTIAQQEQKLLELQEANNFHAQLAATRFSECVDYQEKIEEQEQRIKDLEKQLEHK